MTYEEQVLHEEGKDMGMGDVQDTETMKRKEQPHKAPSDSGLGLWSELNSILLTRELGEKD